MKFDEMVASVPVRQPKIIEVDVSEWISGCMITYAEADIAQIFQTSEDAVEIKKLNPLFPDTLCQTIALLAMCHREPKSDIPIGLMYVELIKKNSDIALYLMNQIMLAFPQMQNMGKLDSAKKNQSEPEPEA